MVRHETPKQNLQMLSPGVAFPTAFLRTFELLVQTLATSAALPRGTIRPRRVAIGALIRRSLPAAVLALAVGSASTPTTVFVLHLSLVSPLRGGVVNLRYSGGVDLVHNTIRRERERLHGKN